MILQRRTRYLVGTAAGIWAVAISVVVASAHGDIGDLPNGVPALLGAACVASTVIAAADWNFCRIADMDQRAVVPVREAFLHGMELGQVNQQAGQVTIIPQRIYTDSEPRTADGATTVDLSEARQASVHPLRRRTGRHHRPSPRP